jgi:hypothetical protein
MNKTCSRCNTERSLDRFYQCKKTLKYKSVCRECGNEKRREYLARPDVKQAKLAKDAIYRNKPEHRAHAREIQAKWYVDNREDKLRKNYEAEKLRLATNPQARLVKSMRVRTRDALNGTKKANKTLDMLGCSSNQLREWMEFQFSADINWTNYGTYWHVDHVTPCASFDLTLVEQQLRCFHWTNLNGENSQYAKTGQDRYARYNVSQGYSRKIYNGKR